MRHVDQGVLTPPLAVPSIRSHPWMAVGIALAVGLASGLLAALVAPRGATTTGDALLLIALALATGLVCGVIARSRWILVPAFLLHVIGLELGRADVVAASLEIRLDTTYGIIAFVITRGLHALLILLPMAVGTALGIGLARRLGRQPASGGRRRPVGTVALAGATVALAVLVAWPASTPPVLGPDGRSIPGSIAELTRVRLGGEDQTILVRAADPSKPVLLYLSGGPGQSDLAFSRAFTTGWVQDFVVVDLDQRGNGTSYPAIDPVGSMTIQRAVDDVIELTVYLRARFDEQRIYLMGESWGTILGVLAVQQRPDLFHAYLGSGQMVDVLETDRRIYEDLVAQAAESGDMDLVATLLAVGEPPYRDFPWTNSNLLAWYELLYGPYTPSPGYLARGEAAGFIDPFGVTGTEYGLVDKVNVLRGLLDTFALMYPQLYDLDLRETASRLDIPVYVLDGAAELEGRRSLALEWFHGLEAPVKLLVTYEGAAHSVAFEQADAVQRLLVETVVPATYER